MEQRSYEVTISDTTAKPERSPIAGNSAPSKQTSGDQSPSAATGIAKGIIAVESYVKPFADKLVTNRIQTVTLRTGADELQEKLSFAYSVGQEAYGVIKSAAVGAAVGSLPGAIIGAVMGMLNTAITYAQKAQQINYQRAIEDTGLKYMNIRAGGSVAAYSQSRQITQ